MMNPFLGFFPLLLTSFVNPTDTALISRDPFRMTRREPYSKNLRNPKISVIPVQTIRQSLFPAVAEIKIAALFANGFVQQRRALLRRD
jgi:hypothetical protein